jgi:catabolite regulation protein CreA
MTLRTRLVCILIVVFITFLFTLTGNAETGELGKIKAASRLVQGDDYIHIIRVDDPDNPFISIFFTTIRSGKFLAMADPSNTSIAARLTGEIPVIDGKRMINTTPTANIASVKKSIGSKVMKIARLYDADKDTMIYLVYTTKWIEGSLKHCLSVVPLGNPLVN